LSMRADPGADVRGWGEGKGAKSLSLRRGASGRWKGCEWA